VVLFGEHEHATGATNRGNNMRAAIVHVMAGAAVSVLVIIGLILAKLFGWLWMDPLAGIIGAFVIASWAVSLIKVARGILLDMTPDSGMAEKLRQAIESDGDKLADLHLRRLGPGHLGAIVQSARIRSGALDIIRPNWLASGRCLTSLSRFIIPLEGGVNPDCGHATRRTCGR
jgi:cation diffusion facilitator family transporter